jgi:predicted acyltransferase (DUF342 family)
VSALAFLALMLALAVWLLLPLIPALRELARPTDDEPLTMVGQDAGDLTVFADGFRAYLARELPASLAVPRPHVESVDAMRDGTPLVQLNGRPELIDELADPERTVRHLVLTSGPLRLAGEETFMLEVYARDRFVGGPDAAYRALLAEQDAVLGDRSSVMRWIHAERNLTVGSGSRLAGRASAGETLRLRVGVSFGRVRAARIVVGDGEPALPLAREPLTTTTLTLPRSARRNRAHVRIEGDFAIPSGAEIVGTLVVTADLRVGAGARVGGSIKAHGSVLLEDAVVIDGSVVARGQVRVGRHCLVDGPIIAEHEVMIRTDTSVGRPGLPSTISARRISMERGAQLFGALAPRAGGQTIDRTERGERAADASEAATPAT